MVPRQTLARAIALEGVGLHTGKAVRMALLPAAAGTGVVFIRTDAGGARIPASLDHVADSYYSTVLEAGPVRVGTIEHLMAALAAFQIDDVAVEVDGPELPIMDGSSLPFVHALEQAGTADQCVERLYLTLTKPVSVSEEGKRVAAYPSSDYRITYGIDFDHPMLGYQELSIGLWGGQAFTQKLAPARTFTFDSEVEALRNRGLALGGSLDNALVLARDRILNPELRFPDEFVRHKMLDLTGDLALLGSPLRAHVVAYRAGHDMHLRLARRIASQPECWYLGPWSDGSDVRNAAAPG